MSYRPTGNSITALIATYQEEANIVRCLEGLEFADDVLVVDTPSGDRTAALARSKGARVEQYPGIEVAGKPKRTWALETLPIETDWILVLDADEVVTRELAAEIRSATRRPDFDAYFLRFRTEFMGQWIWHCGFYPTFQLRLFRRGFARYEDPIFAWEAEMGDVEVHERIQSSGSVGTLRADLLHYDYRGMSNWIAKHNRYSSWEARRRLARTDALSPKHILQLLKTGDWADRRRAYRGIAYYLPGRPLFTFLWMYVLRLGFLDGFAGLAFSVLHAHHQFTVDLKVRELGESRDATTQRLGVAPAMAKRW